MQVVVDFCVNEMVIHSFCQCHPFLPSFIYSLIYSFLLLNASKMSTIVLAVHFHYSTVVIVSDYDIFV